MDNLHPTFAAILEPYARKDDSSPAGAGLSPNIPAAPPATEVAHPDYIARKVLASGATGRAADVEACKAEIAWATRHGGTEPGWGLGIVDGWFTPPPVRTAARVLNVWGHLHPHESRARTVGRMIVARREAGWDVSEQRLDLRWYIGERVKLKATLAKAIAAYRAARETVDA